MDDPLRCLAITVRPDRVICDVEVAAPEYCMTDGPAATAVGLVVAVVSRYPELPGHTCINDQGETFGDCLGSTSVVHVVEHLAIALQGRGPRGQGASLVGRSRWTDRPSRRARIELSYADDLAALEALKQALSVVNGLLASYEPNRC